MSATFWLLVLCFLGFIAVHCTVLAAATAVFRPNFRPTRILESPSALDQQRRMAEQLRHSLLPMVSLITLGYAKRLVGSA